MPLAPGPIVADATWQAAMARADYQCQCIGGCGRTHSKEPGHRCQREHKPWCHLVASPKAPSDDPHRDLRADLVAYCPNCFDGHLAATRRARRAVDTTHDNVVPLF